MTGGRFNLRYRHGSREYGIIQPWPASHGWRSGRLPSLCARRVAPLRSFWVVPVAAAMAAYGGDALLQLLEMDGADNLKEIPEAIAGNLGNVIAGAA